MAAVVKEIPPSAPPLSGGGKVNIKRQSPRELFRETTDINSSSWPKYLIKRGDTDPDLAFVK